MGKRKDSQTNNRESPNSADNTESLVYFDLVHSHIILNYCAMGQIEVGMKMVSQTTSVAFEVKILSSNGRAKRPL
ncbi:hypothetical protein TIFTF001_028898 [Ficus carica]|uniref:Uncharacterized protein n=1 Tax=Ficus carica TaxID=3494 RepID=A0AA88DTH9_FICCA|nr:hypothetical protein TIFTF001_028898 [Ficus carica]